MPHSTRGLASLLILVLVSLGAFGPGEAAPRSMPPLKGQGTQPAVGSHQTDPGPIAEGDIEPPTELSVAEAPTEEPPSLLEVAPASTPDAAGPYRVLLPLVHGAGQQPAVGPEWLRIVNEYRELAGVPPAAEDATLSANCREHARYMAENGQITHHQDPGLSWASAAGEICASKGNAWMGGAHGVPYWTVERSIESWMGSAGHRLWLLYPTTPAFGYGFYTAANNRAAAGLDGLSRANMSADTSYSRWPIRYPAPDQRGVPAKKYPITLNWRYFGPAPTLQAVTLTTQDGSSIAHTANTDLPVRHKGVQILPTEALPPNTTIVVSVSGTYQGTPFTFRWSFTTGSV